MTTCTVAALKEAFERSPSNANTIARYVGGTNHKFDEEAVKLWLDNNKKNHLDNALTKGTRPWEIVNLTERLDRKQPWIGVEYETGFNKKEHYNTVINYLWQNHPFTAIDYEGCGRYQCEITFPPVNLDAFMADDYKINQLIGLMEKSAPKAPHKGWVGMHINISTPAYRKIKNCFVSNRIAHSIDVLLKAMAAADKTRLFGRVPYGYVYPQYLGKNKWIEFKLFDSVSTVEEWNKYKPVAVKLAELIEYLSLNQHLSFMQYVDQDNKGYQNYYDMRYDVEQYSVAQSSNVVEFLDGKISPDKIVLAYSEPKNHNAYHTYHGF